MTDPTKPGVKTSEFWVTILTAALAFAAALSSAMGWAFDATRYQTLIPVAATVLAGLVAHGFVLSRAKVKTAAINAAPVTVVQEVPSASTTPTVTFPTAPVVWEPSEPAPVAPVDPPADDVPPL